MAFRTVPDAFEPQSPLVIRAMDCSACGTCNIFLTNVHSSNPDPASYHHVWPPDSEREVKLDKRVPRKYAAEFREAVAVLSISPKSSAALSRRLLQRLLQNEMQIKGPNLEDEIQQAIKNKQLPAELVTDLDAVRKIGNFAAHPIKSTNTGEIIDVEPGEADWQIDTIRALFDHIFVKPALFKKRQASLNKKLAAAKKPLLKT
jgi:hypothetical protein